MGLKEKREKQAFIDNQFPEIQKTIFNAAKFEPEMDIQWDAIATDGESHLYAEAWPKVYFEPLVEAFTSITQDDMGAEALKESLKKIVITNDGNNSNGNKWCQYENGVLTLTHKPTSNVSGSGYAERVKSVTKNIEDAL